MSTRILIRNARVVTMDPALGDLDRGDVLVDGEHIVKVLPSPSPDREHLGEATADSQDNPTVQVVDGTDFLVAPGFVDTDTLIDERPDAAGEPGAFCRRPGPDPSGRRAAPGRSLPGVNALWDRRVPEARRPTGPRWPVERRVPWRDAGASRRVPRRDAGGRGRDR